MFTAKWTSKFSLTVLALSLALASVGCDKNFGVAISIPSNGAHVQTCSV